MMRHLEVAVDSLEAALAAATHADRLEVCRDLASHGRTADPALVRAIRLRIDLPVVALVRTSDSWTPTDGERRRMFDEASLLREAGATAIAFGALTPDGDIDVPLCESLIRACTGHGVSAVLHRSFDVAAHRDLHRAADDAARAGFERVLCAGAPTLNTAVIPTESRAAAIRAAHAAANGRFRIVTCGGIRSTTPADLTLAGDDIHSSCVVRGQEGMPAPLPSEQELLSLRTLCDQPQS